MTYADTLPTAEWKALYAKIDRTEITTNAATFTGRGEFYSGIQPGDEVTVTRSVHTYPDYYGVIQTSVRYSAQGVGEKAGAHLSVQPSEFEAAAS